MTFLIFVALLVVVILAIGLEHELTSYISNKRLEARLQNVPIVVAKATSVRRYFRRRL